MNTQLLERILEISRQMAETHDIDELLQFAMEEVIELVGASFGYLVLLGLNDELQFRVRYGLETDGDNLSHTIFNEVIKSGEPLLVNNAMMDERYAAVSSVAYLQIRSVMCVPLIARGAVTGGIYVENRTVAGAFRNGDLPPLVFFANQAAVSIENAMLINDLEARVTARTAEVERGWHDAIEANKLRTTFLGQLAHDMRTPISVVKMALGSLTNPKVGPLNEKQAQWIERADHSIDHLNHLIQNVFDLTKLELGTVQLHLEQVNLSEFLARVFDIGSALRWSEGVEFRSDVPINLPTLQLDPIRIQQVLLNLIGNAVKFTANGSVTLHAWVRQANAVEIGVRDTGEGIPADKLALVFDRFQQFDENHVRRQQGAGLGLAICRDLVEKHGGTIWVTSELGQGSDFVFALPL